MLSPMNLVQYGRKHLMINGRYRSGNLEIHHEVPVPEPLQLLHFVYVQSADKSGYLSIRLQIAFLYRSLLHSS